MRRYYGHTALLRLILTVLMLGSTLALKPAAGAQVFSVFNRDQREIVSVAMVASNAETILIVRTDGKMMLRLTDIVDAPPRIIYDLFYDGPPFESWAEVLTHSKLKQIRIGFHPNIIRLVLDLNGPDIPGFSSLTAEQELIVKLGAGSEKPEETGDDTIALSAPARSKDADISEKRMSFNKPSPPETINPSQESTRVRTGIGETGAAKTEPEDIPQLDPGLLLKELTHVETNDAGEDTVLFSTGTHAFRERRWSQAVDSLKNYIQRYPKGKYAEKAYFLLAKSYEQFYSHAIPEHFTRVKNHYENAVYGFPSSRFVPTALLAIGDICRQANNNAEAMGYYNLVIQNKVDGHAAAEAMLKKGDMLMQAGNYAEALSHYESVVQNYPGSFGETAAHIGMAKALFELNSFSKSLILLTKLAEDPENISNHHEILYYLGNNYYQMSDYAKARVHLYRYYNIQPDNHESHLVLSRIGDTYREEGRFGDATKIYRWVLDRFPQTEGALISLTRLAEQQEQNELKIKRDNLISVNFIDEKIDPPRKIYERVIHEAVRTNKQNPLVEYALLKLALLHRKEKDYVNSLEILKSLLKSYPHSKLRRDTLTALNDTFMAVVGDEAKKENYIGIVNSYHREKELIDRLDSPKALIAVARAFCKIGLQDTAADLYQKADAFLSEEEKPEDLLIFTARYHFENGRAQIALERINSLVAQFPTGEHAGEAYHLKGTIFQNQKKFRQAVEMFSFALKSNPGRADRVKILIDKARSQKADGQKAESLATLHEVENRVAKNPQETYFAYEGIGEIYLGLDKPTEALVMFTHALKFEKDGSAALKLKLLTARCHEALNQKNEYAALYNQIAGLDDSLWSRVARERIEALQFEDMLKKAPSTANRR